MMSVPDKTEQLNINFAQSLADDLRRERLVAAIQAANGAWRDEDHPELATPEEIDRWIADNRANQTRHWAFGNFLSETQD